MLPCAFFSALSLAFLPAVISAPTDVASESPVVIRVDDILVLKGSVIEFDPVGGLNETTRDGDWQTEYLEHHFDKINRALEKQGPVINNQLDTRIEPQNNGGTCLVCMLTMLAGGNASSRVRAFQRCSPCLAVSMGYLRVNLEIIWTSVAYGPYGIGAYGGQNFATQTWQKFPGW